VFKRSVRRAERIEGERAAAEARGVEDAVDGGEIRAHAGEEVAEVGGARAADLDLAARFEGQPPAAGETIPQGIKNCSDIRCPDVA
jgi:hypothetical protein